MSEAQIIYPTAANGRPVNPLVMNQWPHMAGEFNQLSAYVAGLVFEPQMVGEADPDSGYTGTIQRVAADEMIKLGSNRRSPGAQIEMTPGVQLSPVTFRCEEYSRGGAVPGRSQADTQGINLYSANIAADYHNLLLQREARLDTFLFGQAWHPSDGNGIAAWDNAAGDPMADIGKAVKHVPGANVAIMSREVFFAMATNANMRAYIGDNTDRTFIDLNTLRASLLAKFGLRLFVSDARKSVAGTESYVLSDSAWIGRVGAAPVEIGPRAFRVGASAGVRMAVDVPACRGNSRASRMGEWLVEEWSDPSRRTDLYSIGHCEDLVQLAPVAGWEIDNLIT